MIAVQICRGLRGSHHAQAELQEDVSERADHRLYAL